MLGEPELIGPVCVGRAGRDEGRETADRIKSGSNSAKNPSHDHYRRACCSNVHVLGCAYRIMYRLEVSFRTLLYSFIGFRDHPSSPRSPICTIRKDGRGLAQWPRQARQH